MAYPSDFKPGDPPPNSAAFFRDLLKMLREWKRGLFGRIPEDVNTKRIVGYVKNVTDSHLDMYSVLALGDPVFTRGATEKDDRFIAEGSTPTEIEHHGRFAVLLEPVRNGSVGRAVLSGLCIAKVNVTDTAHRWADVTISDNSKLTSRWAGGAEIITKPSGTGTKLLWVRIGHAYQGPQKAILTYNLYGGESVEAELDDGRTVRVKCRLFDESYGLPIGTPCEVMPQPHEDDWTVLAEWGCVVAAGELDPEDDEPEE